ncbi:sigma factor-like helix-turn-helix DNA-binding protein [Nakamurella sp. PAMC28650]|uniref:sigma factor-like helix-turn-helix DNA-binding protein n=1 Tax=Nakamurella sp. PAMC28650 TaxID=2762325 RepID=UPI00164EB2C8|nr:sigma factor-like helix-turn-helix DNA-binding protein [Nakamurella sp. PAMC28650]QNK79822.1 SigE family RNA polymerase sigma factor [Nakamurella sp. PAMC28650]
MTFDEFLGAELTGLRKYAAVLTGDPHRAQDVLAEALLRAHTSWPRIGAMEFPAAYVRRMVTSQFLSDKRRWSVRMIRSTRTGELPDVHLSDPSIAADDRAQLRYLLAALAPRPRAAIVLRYYLGLDTDEIADELSVTVGAVRTAISRGLAAMRIAVADEQAVSGATPNADGPADRFAPAAVVHLSPVHARFQEDS